MLLTKPFFKNCFDANLEMVETRDPDNFLRFPLQEWREYTISEITLNGILINMLSMDDLRIDIRTKEMLNKTPCKKCCFISFACSIVKFIGL